MTSLVDVVSKVPISPVSVSSGVSGGPGSERGANYEYCSYQAYVSVN